MEEAACTLVLEDPTPPGTGKGRKQRVGYPRGPVTEGRRGFFWKLGGLARSVAL